MCYLQTGMQSSHCSEFNSTPLLKDTTLLAEKDMTLVTSTIQEILKSSTQNIEVTATCCEDNLFDASTSYEHLKTLGEITPISTLSHEKWSSLNGKLYRLFSYSLFISTY